MKITGRNALGLCGLAALLSACAASSIPSDIADNGNAHARTSKQQRRFNFIGKEARFVVPSGVTSLTVVADGAIGGGDTQGNYSEPPGFGGEVSAVVPVQPGEKLYVFVGGKGTSGRSRGYNGGGQGGSSEYGDAYYGGEHPTYAKAGMGWTIGFWLRAAAVAPAEDTMAAAEAEPAAGFAVAKAVE